MFENLNYALVQLAHNFGAAAVVGFPVLALYVLGQTTSAHRKFAWIVGLSWAVQALSGAGFGAVSYYYYQVFPDLHGVAFAALLIKILCAVGGIFIAAKYIRESTTWTSKQRRNAWRLLSLLGVMALTAAAFLRWYA
ncbi:hypothetical protein SAMN05216404_10695 [Nitrosospira multiformis]|uniref:Uncharacterized protein n=1 Tax=Nitrosospira multiformis TaxID=1231 RepID=A0A1H8ILQ0_9PROT|nr:hypothetical protein [Nitrosospira multiformis]SEN68658.1 hypothetical protein SAMN05216404_10695 [Nitrosospira multiformis]